MRYLLTLRWLGTAYCGWQVQPNKPTVCGTVQDAVEKLFGKRGELTGCSRTDSGVHAVGFAAALRCEGCHLEPGALQRALNVNLPRDIAVTGCRIVEEDFHPRYDAAAKRYRYRWYQSETRDPFREGLAVQLPRPVETAAMNEAAARLLGTHNFSAFCAAGGKIPPEERVRTLTECAVTQTGDEVHLTLEKQGRFIRLAVDNGVENLPRDVVDNMFDRFYRGDRARASDGGGHGIGLSIARAIVSAHRGKISAAVSAGRLTVTALLPAD